MLQELAQLDFEQEKNDLNRSESGDVAATRGGATYMKFGTDTHDGEA